MITRDEWHAIIKKQIAIQELWSLNLRDAVNNSRTGNLKPEQVSDDTACSFGMWLATDEAKNAIGLQEQFDNIVNLHKTFHTCAADLLRLVSSNDALNASAMLEPTGMYTIASTNLTDSLRSLICETTSNEVSAYTKRNDLDSL